MKALLIILCLVSVSRAQFTAPADTVISMPLSQARQIVRGIQLLQADTAKKAEIIFAQDHLLSSLNAELAISAQKIAKLNQIVAADREQAALAAKNELIYKQMLKDSEPTIFEHWYVQIPIGLIIGGVVAYKILK